MPTSTRLPAPASAPAAKLALLLQSRHVFVLLQKVTEHPLFRWRKPGQRFALGTQRSAEHLRGLLHAPREGVLIEKAKDRLNVVEDYPSFAPPLRAAEIV